MSKDKRVLGKVGMALLLVFFLCTNIIHDYFFLQ